MFSKKIIPVPQLPPSHQFHPRISSEAARPGPHLPLRCPRSPRDPRRAPSTDRWRGGGSQAGRSGNPWGECDLNWLPNGGLGPCSVRNTRNSSNRCLRAQAFATAPENLCQLTLCEGASGVPKGVISRTSRKIRKRREEKRKEKKRKKKTWKKKVKNKMKQ